MNTSVTQNAKKILHEKISETDSIIYVYEEHIRREGEKSALIGKIVGLVIPSVLMIALSFPIGVLINNTILEFTKSNVNSTFLICIAIISIAFLLLTLVYKYSSQLILVNKIVRGLNNTKTIRQKLFENLNSIDSYTKNYSKLLDNGNQTLKYSNDIQLRIEEQKNLCSNVGSYNSRPFEMMFGAMYWISIVLVTIACLFTLYPLMTYTIGSSFDSNIANIAGGVFVIVAIVAAIAIQVLFLTKRDSVFAGSYLSGLAIAPASYFAVTILVYIVSGIIAIIGAIIVIAIIIGIIAALLSS